MSSLSAEAFLATYDRFVARRGLCSNIFSDCGANTVDDSRELREGYQTFKEFHDVIQNHLAAKGIVRHFSPPSDAHFSGLLEASVKSPKFHLTCIAGDRPFTYEVKSFIALVTCEKFHKTFLNPMV